MSTADQVFTGSFSSPRLRSTGEIGSLSYQAARPSEKLREPGRRLVPAVQRVHPGDRDGFFQDSVKKIKTAHEAREERRFRRLTCRRRLYSDTPEMPPAERRIPEEPRRRPSLRDKHRTGDVTDSEDGPGGAACPSAEALSPGALRNNLLEARWTRGRTRHSRGSLFWLRLTPCPSSTIQSRSKLSPRRPTGHSCTCGQQQGQGQDRRNQRTGRGPRSPPSQHKI